MTFISKTAGALGGISCISDIHKTALIYSHNAKAKTSANAIISDSIGAQMAGRISPRDAARKNWLARENFFLGPKEFFASVKGYFQGLGIGIVRRLPSLAFSSVALLAKNKTMAGIATIGLAICEVWDFLKNATNLFTKTDYLK